NIFETRQYPDDGTGRVLSGHDEDDTDLRDQAGIRREIGGRRMREGGNDEKRQAERRHAKASRRTVVHGFSSRTNFPLSASKTRMRTTTPARARSTSRTCTSLRSAVGR